LVACSASRAARTCFVIAFSASRACFAAACCAAHVCPAAFRFACSDATYSVRSNTGCPACSTISRPACPDTDLHQDCPAFPAGRSRRTDPVRLAPLDRLKHKHDRPGHSGSGSSPSPSEACSTWDGVATAGPTAAHMTANEAPARCAGAISRSVALAQPLAGTVLPPPASGRPVPVRSVRLVPARPLPLSLPLPPRAPGSIGLPRRPLALGFARLPASASVPRSVPLSR